MPVSLSPRSRARVAGLRLGSSLQRTSLYLETVLYSLLQSQRPLSEKSRMSSGCRVRTGLCSSGVSCLAERVLQVQVQPHLAHLYSKRDGAIEIGLPE